jgi:hypothetical protein
MLHHFAIWRRQAHPAVLRGSKKLHMHMKVPSTTMLSFPALSPLLTAGKKYSQIFFEQGGMLTTLPPSVIRLSGENMGALTSHNPVGLHGLLEE